MKIRKIVEALCGSSRSQTSDRYGFEFYRQAEKHFRRLAAEARDGKKEGLLFAIADELTYEAHTQEEVDEIVERILRL